MSASQFVLRALTCRSGPACAATRSRGLSKMASSSSLSSTRRVGGARVKPSMGYSASFSVGAVRRAGKESSLGKEDRAEEVERAKHEQLREQKEGKGQWKDELASDSESIVKADRGEFNANQETIKKLQEETEKMAKKSR